MLVLVVGLTIFVALHLIPCVPSRRTTLLTSLGEKSYRTVFSIGSFIGLGLIIWGFSMAEYQPVYEPFSWGRSMALTLVPIAVILFAAANMPTHIRAFVRHPMLAGLFLWALAHLAANGDQRSIVLFGTLGIYAVVATISSVSRSKGAAASKAPRWTMDIVAVVAGIIVASLLAKFHGTLFGMPLM